MGLYEKVGSEIRKVPRYHEVCGYRVAPIFSINSFHSALNYLPQEGDLFVASYPKSGTTWLQQIVGLIYRKGEPYHGAIDFFCSSPFLELSGAEAAEAPDRSPGPIKTHLAYHLVPKSPLAKYIYIARNPKDCCVSFYYQVKSLPFNDFEDGTFGDFFELFINGKCHFGDYFDNVLSWYSHKDDENVLFLTYENMKLDISGHILKIAEFMGSDHLLSLERDPVLLRTIIERCSFRYMRKNSNYYDNFLQVLEEAFDHGALFPSALRKIVVNYRLVKTENCRKEINWNFFRKGNVGDWKNHYTQKQNQLMEEWITYRTAGTDVMSLWAEY